MPFLRRTLTELRDGALEDIAAANIFDTTTGQVVNPVLLLFDPLTIEAKVMAGLAYEEYGYLDWVALQSTPASATDEQAYAWGALKGVTLKAATAAAAVAQFAGVAESDVPSGSQLARQDGTTYTTTADAIIGTNGTITAPFLADTTGAAGTLTVGAVLTLKQTLPGVQSTATVAAVNAPGSDIETFDAYKQRYLYTYANPPAGGSLTDYQEWALAVPGCTRAWTLGSAAGPGTVGLYVMFDISEAATNGFPVGSNGVATLEHRDVTATGDQLDVADALYSLRPVTALVYVIAPLSMPIIFTIANLGKNNTTDNQAAVLTALLALFLAVGDPRGITLFPSSWEGAIALALGPQTSYTLISPLGPIVIPVGSLPTTSAAYVTMTA